MRLHVKLSVLDLVPVREQRVSSMGLDIAMVLDLSSSMEEVMGGASGSKRE